MKRLIKNKIRNIKHWPRIGIVFKDIMPALKDAKTLKRIIGMMYDECFKSDSVLECDYVVGIESRGFILGPPVALKIDCGFIPVRKKNKLPTNFEAPVVTKRYTTEYSTPTLEMHDDDLSGKKIIIIDDLIATGGSMKATINLVEKLGGEIFKIVALVDLKFLGGSDELKKMGYDVSSIIKYR